MSSWSRDVGPVIEHRSGSLADVERLTVPEPEESVPFILEAVSIVRRELRPDQARDRLLRRPFTVAGYLIEGKPSREFLNVKRMMYADPTTWHALMEKLTDAFARYVQAKVRAGADVIQLFDSWVGALSPADYEEFVQPYSARILAAVDCPDDPLRHRHGDAARADARGRRGRDRASTGESRSTGAGRSSATSAVYRETSTGAILLGPWERVQAATLDVLARAAGRPGHIFNLGHGVMPDTDPDVLGRLRAFVHEQTARVPV
jgi:uroporphyrinogen decarboxylase